MKVRFIGTEDPTDDTECTAFGLSFTKGEWVEIGDAAQQLLTNPTFEVKATKAKAAPDPEPASEVAPEPSPSPE